MRLSIVLATVLAVAVSAAPRSERIVGGEVTTIDNYPFQAAMLRQQLPDFFMQSCGGSIINNRAILSAAHCFDAMSNTVDNRVRVGSTFANSGGVVHYTSQIIIHPSYNPVTVDSDIAIVWTASIIVFNSLVQQAPIAGPNYNLADDQVVWAAGWGSIEWTGPISEQLRHVQVWTVNQELCNQRYGGMINDNMLCAGWLDADGRGQCQNDSGGPLVHNGVIVGVCSFGIQCGTAQWPTVNVKVSRFTAWIQANA